VSLERSEKKQMDHATKYSAEVDVASFFVGSNTESKKGGRHMMRRYWFVTPALCHADAERLWVQL
jgi:hypothetical protein